MNERARANHDFMFGMQIAPRYPNLQEYPETGEGRWIIRQGQPWPKTIEDGNHMYVVLPDGKIRVSMIPRPKGKIHHPELVKGKEVIAAGIVKIKNREVVLINNESGHYCPDSDCVNYAARAFRHWEIPLSKDVVLDGSWVCK